MYYILIQTKIEGNYLGFEKCEYVAKIHKIQLIHVIRKHQYSLLQYLEVTSEINIAV